MPSAYHLAVQPETLSANLNHVRNEINLLLKIRLWQSATSWLHIDPLQACCALSRLIQVCSVVHQFFVLVHCNLTARYAQIVKALANSKHVFPELFLRLNLKVIITPYTLGLVLVDTHILDKTIFFFIILALVCLKAVKHTIHAQLDF